MTKVDNKHHLVEQPLALPLSCMCTQHAEREKDMKQDKSRGVQDKKRDMEH